VQVAQGVLADFVAAQQRRFQTVPLEHADSCGGAGRAVSGAAGGYPLGVGATAP
jgi:hypothetical protein